jgi:hypothetical protein
MHNNFIKICFISCLSVFPFSALANSPTEEDVSVESQGWVEDFLQKIGADGEYDPDKLIDFSVLPGPFYSPEMDLGLGVSAIGLYQADKDDKVSQLSSLVINGFLSTNGSVGMVVENKTFLNEDTQRFYLTLEMADAPDVYYGQGYDENSLDENKVDFDYQQLGVNPMWLQRLSSASFIGGGLAASYGGANKIKPDDSLVDSDLLEENSRSVGASFLINYDSRDNVLNPVSGRIIQFESVFYREFLGSKTDFEVYDLLYSEYMEIGHDEDVLAWQTRGQFTSGDVPWDHLAKVGGGTALRGYLWGRYRDKQMLLTQVEYRLNLPRRHGMVFWLGAGLVTEDLSHFSSDEILPSSGVGYRFEVKPKVNLRLDLAFGDGDTSFYFNVQEAF